MRLANQRTQTSLIVLVLDPALEVGAHLVPPN